LWIPIRSPEPLTSGSLGAGLLLSPHTIIDVCVDKSGDGVCEGLCIEPVDYIVKRCKVHVKVFLVKGYPLASGFAMSSSLSIAVGIAAAIALGLPLEKGLEFAHEAEVVSGTGLGDVIAQSLGKAGLVLRKAPGAPGIGRVESYIVPRKPVLAIQLGTMTTREMHQVLRDKLYRDAAPLLAKVYEDPTLETFLDAANKFSRLARFTPSYAEYLDLFVRKGWSLGWYVKKKVLIIVVERDRLEDVVAYLERLKVSNAYPLELQPKPLEVEVDGGN